MTDNKNKGNSPKPQGQQNPRPATEGTRTGKGTFGEQSANVNKGISNDIRINKPKR